MTQSPDNTKNHSGASRLARGLAALMRELPPPPDVSHFTVRSHGCSPSVPVRKLRKPPTLASALKQAAKAGKSVKGAELYPDRTVLQFGEPESTEPENSWPLDEFRPKETRQ